MRDYVSCSGSAQDHIRGPTWVQNLSNAMNRGTTSIANQFLYDVERRCNRQILRSLRCVIEGGGSAHVLIPRMIALFMKGLFPFDRLIRFYDFEEINQAVSDSEQGETLKAILRIVLETPGKENFLHREG